jgi:short-subunit dehydrogenase
MNILITGCSKGIGKDIVKYLLESGEHKIIGISSNKDVLSRFSEDNLKSFFPLITDFSQLNFSRELIVNEVEKHFDRLDVIINNAGILINKPFQSFSADEILKSFNVNLFAPAELIRLLIPFMGKQSTSHIVNIGSMGGFQGSSKYKGLSWYSASKAALANLTECLAEEFKNQNICVNCLALGAVETEMFNNAFPGYKAPVTSKEMAKFIADFALSGHKLFNGKIIPVALSNP